jgi:hypothetical protein
MYICNAMRLRQEDFKASLNYILKPCLKKKSNQTKENETKHTKQSNQKNPKTKQKTY